MGTTRIEKSADRNGRMVLKCIRRAGVLLNKFQRNRFLISNGHIEKQLKLFIGAAWEDIGKGRAYVMDKRFNGPELDLLAFDKGQKPVFWMETKCGFADKNWNKEKEDFAMSEDRKSTKRKTKARNRYEAYSVAEQAIEQTGKYMEQLMSAGKATRAVEGRPARRKPPAEKPLHALKECPAYIVHFLTEFPADNEKYLPPWVIRRFDSDRPRRAPSEDKSQPRRPKEAKPATDWRADERDRKLPRFLGRLNRYYANQERYEQVKIRYHSSQIVPFLKTPRIDALVVRLAKTD